MKMKDYKTIDFFDKFEGLKSEQNTFTTEKLEVYFVSEYSGSTKITTLFVSILNHKQNVLVYEKTKKRSLGNNYEPVDETPTSADCMDSGWLYYKEKVAKDLFSLYNQLFAEKQKEEAEEKKRRERRLREENQHIKDVLDDY